MYVINHLFNFLRLFVYLSVINIAMTNDVKHIKPIYTILSIMNCMFKLNMIIF
jgi:hypothetical protein